MQNAIKKITAEVTINKPVEIVWKTWTTPADIMQWNIPFDDWHSPKVENDVKEGGQFLFRMESKESSEGFDHSGTYDKVINNQLVEYTVSDGRKSIIQFLSEGDKTRIIESFEPEAGNPVDMQRDFCQSVLNNFKRYAENKTS